MLGNDSFIEARDGKSGRIVERQFQPAEQFHGDPVGQCGNGLAPNVPQDYAYRLRPADPRCEFPWDRSVTFDRLPDRCAGFQYRTIGLGLGIELSRPKHGRQQIEDRLAPLAQRPLLAAEPFQQRLNLLPSPLEHAPVFAALESRL